MLHVLMGRTQLAHAPASKHEVLAAVQVNSKMQTSNPDVYAVGDIAAFPLTKCALLLAGGCGYLLIACTMSWCKSPCLCS